MSDATEEVVTQAMALAEAARFSANDPGDQVRLMSALAAFAVAPVPSVAPIGQAIGTVQNAIAALCRRAALVSLARACAAYQPTSSNDALAVLQAVAPLIDAEMTAAADAGETTAYSMLRNLLSAVANDLTTRGAQLPALRDVVTRVSLPALALAYELYGDATRADDLIERADPVHPAIMPREFKALTS